MKSNCYLYLASMMMFSSSTLLAQSPAYNQAANNCDFLIDDSLALLRKQYISDLEHQTIGYQQKGDLQTILEIKKEIERVKGNSSFEERIKADQELLSLFSSETSQGRNLNDLQKLEEKELNYYKLTYEEISDLVVAMCATTVKQLTTAGKLDDAIAVKGEMDKICKTYNLKAKDVQSAPADIRVPRYVKITNLPMSSHILYLSIGVMVKVTGVSRNELTVAGPRGQTVFDGSIVPITATDFSTRSTIRQKAYSELSAKLFQDTGKKSTQETADSQARIAQQTPQLPSVSTQTPPSTPGLEPPSNTTLAKPTTFDELAQKYVPTGSKINFSGNTDHTVFQKMNFVVNNYYYFKSLNYGGLKFDPSIETFSSPESETWIVGCWDDSTPALLLIFSKSALSDFPIQRDDPVKVIGQYLGSKKIKTTHGESFDLPSFRCLGLDTGYRFRDLQ